jgi:hypothetical protein
MSKETPELVAETWALLVDYIPRREHVSAAEQLLTYLETVLDKGELLAIAELDSDLAEAYNSVIEEIEDESDWYNEDDEDGE